MHPEEPYQNDNGNVPKDVLRGPSGAAVALFTELRGKTDPPSRQAALWMIERHLNVFAESIYRSMREEITGMLHCREKDAGAQRPSDISRSLTVKSVAATLECHQNQVRDLIARGELQAHRLGDRGIRVLEESLHVYRRATRIWPTKGPQRPNSVRC
jgi:excisionase family DNA binding protein